MAQGMAHAPHQVELCKVPVNTYDLVKLVAITEGAVTRLVLLDTQTRRLPENPAVYRKHMPQLQCLHLSQLPLTELPPVLTWLPPLTDLALHGMVGLQHLPSLERLTRLRSLRLAACPRLLRLPAGLPALASCLRTLSLTDLRLQEVPDAVYSLARLQELDLSDNNIEHVSERLARLSQLHCLVLTNNKLSSLPYCLLAMLRNNDAHPLRLRVSGNVLATGGLPAPAPVIPTLPSVLPLVALAANHVLSVARPRCYDELSRVILDPDVCHRIWYKSVPCRCGNGLACRGVRFMEPAVLATRLVPVSTALSDVDVLPIRHAIRPRCAIRDGL